MTPHGAGLKSEIVKVFRIVNGSYAPGNQDVYSLLTAQNIGLVKTLNSRLSLVSLVCVASAAGTLTFAATNTEYSIAIPLSAGLNIIKAENSIFKHFDRGGDLVMQLATATLTGFEVILTHTNSASVSGG